MQLPICRRDRSGPSLYVIALAVIIAVGIGPSFAHESSVSNSAQLRFEDLPKEAQKTQGPVKTDGPFPYKRDGVTFSNFEGRLPQKARGYYKEYTVPTPGAGDRGARRIIAGRNGQYYYTDDHYKTFRRILE